METYCFFATDVSSRAAVQIDVKVITAFARIFAEQASRVRFLNDI